MDQRRAAGALLALVACLCTTAAAPTASNQTGLDLYDSSIEGCYYNFQHYGEGDRIMTNEPCLNCTCHNRMLMCYLRVCPFTKPIGQDCTVEKRADQCCPIVTCPDVPVDLLTSTTTSPAEYGGTGVGKLDKYGCSINGKYFPEGSKVPPTPNKPCEHCYCIRNMTTCVMQECTLHVDGCTPIYHKDVCCPVRYSCDHPEDETLLLDDMTTTVRPTPGFLLTTTTLSPVTQMSQDCVHDDQIFPDGALIKTEKACEHCYCMKGDIVCVVQECGTPMENEGKNCTSQPPREGQCCPDTYICEGDEVTPDPLSEYTTQSPLLEDLTTRRVGVEGSGYRIEPDEPTYTEIPSLDTEAEGSGYEQPTEPSIEMITPGKENPEATSETVDESLHYATTTLRTPTLEEIEKTTEPDKGLNTVPSDEETYKPSVTEKTAPAEEVTKTPLETDGTQEQDKDRTTVHEESSTPSVTSRIDEISSTTESAFRKDDADHTEGYDIVEDKATTQAMDLEETTIAHDFDAVSETKAPFMEELEKQTTLPTEFTEKDAEPSEPKPPVTESILDISTSADIKPSSIEMTTDTAPPSKTETTTLAVEKLDDTETTNPDENEIEDVSTTLPPGRIPGEGDCLLNEITYRNNSEVPSYNVCDTGCRCISSIVKCDRIVCSPPPDYMSNCQPTYDPPGSCCPTYVCQTGETMPPQPHSQMSGTEKPVSKIECHGDECELNKDKESPTVDSAGEPVTSVCETAECQESSQPSVPQQPTEKCDDGKCLPPAQPCVDGECQGTPVEEPIIVPVKNVPLCDNEEDCKRIKPDESTCQGDGCSDGGVPVDCSGSDCGSDAVTPAVVPEHPQCDNEEDCKNIQPEVPCEGDGCEGSGVHADCSGPECNAVKPPALPEQPLCANEEDCKNITPEIPTCKGDECATVNSECSGADCSTDVIEPVAPEKPLCENEEECNRIKPEVSCSGSDCSTDISKPVEPVLKPDEQICTGNSCRRKESDEEKETLPEKCTGEECDQQIPTIDDLSTSSPDEITTAKAEVQTEVPYTTVTEDKNKIPVETSTESERIETTPASSSDDQGLNTPAFEEKIYTNAPGTTITEKNDEITESPEPEVTKKTVTDEEVQTKAPHDLPEIETTEGPSVTDIQDMRTTVPQELLTKQQDEEQTVTITPEQYTTSVPDKENVPFVPTDKDSVGFATPEPTVPDITKFMEEAGTTEPSVEQDLTTKSPVPLDEQDVTPPHQEIPESAGVTEPAKQETEVTVSNEISDKPTIADEHREITEPNVEFSQTTISDGQQPEQETYYTNAPSEVEDKTSVMQPITEKIPQVSSHITTTTPEYQGTEEQVAFTESPDKHITETFATSEPSPQMEVTASDTTEKEVEQPNIPVLIPQDEERLETTPSHEDDETVTKTPETSMKDDIEKEAPVETDKTDEDTSEKPLTEEKDHKTDLTTENPEINEVEEPVKKPESPVSDISTISPDGIITQPINDDEVKMTESPEQPTDIEESVTAEQEISTEEPAGLGERPEPEQIPPEPYLPVKTDIITEPTFMEAVTTEKSDIVTAELITPISDNKEDTTEVPDKSEIEEKVPTGATELTDVTESVTQSSEPQTEYPLNVESHKDDEKLSETTQHPEDLVTKDEKETSGIVTTEQPKYSEVPSDIEHGPTEETSTLGIRINEETTDDLQKPTETPVLQETTLASSATVRDVETEQTTESRVTDIPESHVKEPEDSDTAEMATTKSDELIPTASQEVLPVETVTENVPEEETKKDEDKPAVPSQEAIESPQELPETPPKEITPDEQSETTEQPIITTQGIDIGATEKLHVTETSVTDVLNQAATEVPEQVQTDVTAHDEVTRGPQDMTTAIPHEKPTEEEQEPTTGKPEVPTQTESDEPSEVTSSPQMVSETAKYPAFEEVATDAGIPQGETTDQHEVDKNKPLEDDQESTTRLPFTSEKDETESSITTSEPDLVELEEHTHKPIDEVSTLSPEEQDMSTSPLETHEEKKPEMTTETEVVEDENIRRTTVFDSDEDSRKATSPSLGQDEDAPVSTTGKPVERFDDNVSSQEPQPSMSDSEIPIQTDRIPTTEKSSELQPSEETTSFEELVPVTSKTPESSEHTKVEDKPEEPEEKPSKTQEDTPEQKPEVEPLDTREKFPDEESVEKPEYTPEEKPAEEPVEKPVDELSEATPKPLSKPEEEPADKPSIESTEQPEEKPFETPAEKPAVEPVEPSTESTERPVETPTEPPVESTEKPVEEAVEPGVESTEKPAEEPVKPAAESTEKPVEEPVEPAGESTQKPVEEPAEPAVESTEKPVEPAVESTENPVEPAVESTEKPVEEPVEPAVESTEKSVEESVEPAVESTEKSVEEALEPGAEFTEKPAEESNEPAVASTEKPVEESVEPAVESTQKPVEEPAEPAVESTEKPIEEPIEPPVESTEKSVEEPVEPALELTEKPVEEPAEPAEKPLEEPIVPTAESTEQPKEQTVEPTEKLGEEFTEKPAEYETTEKQAEEPTDVQKPEEIPVESPTVKPVDEPIDKPSEEPADKPEEQPVEQPAEQPVEIVTETPTDKPMEVPEEKPEEQPSEEPTEKLTEKPVQRLGEPTETPVEETATEQAQGSTENLDKTPLESQTEKPADEPVEKPEEKPLEEPTEKPAEKPEERPAEEATEKPIEEPSEIPTEKPMVEPTDEQAEKAEEKPVQEPSEKPEKTPEEYPTEKPAEAATGAPVESQEPEEKPTEETETKPEEIPAEKATDKPELVTEAPQEKPEEKPQEIPQEKPQEIPVEPTPTTVAPEVSKPAEEVQPTDEVPDDDHFPPSAGTSGYGTEPDYVDTEDQAFGPGTCRYGGKVYVSAQQIPRDDPCDFCFCFRSDIICLQQSCPPPIHGCHEEPIQGFCCPRYECPVAMATTLNVTTTTTTTTTTLPPHFLPHAYKGAAQRRGCQIKGHTYKVGEVVRASSGPCLHCTCGGDGQMKCDPKACTPEPMLRQMIAAAVSAKRRR